jgi:hypothetical protein
MDLVEDAKDSDVLPRSEEESLDVARDARRELESLAAAHVAAARAISVRASRMIRANGSADAMRVYYAQD